MTRLESSRVREIRETVYLDAVNPIRLRFEQYNVATDAWDALDLTTAASFAVELIPALANAGSAQGPFSTGTYPDIVTAPVAGRLVLTLGELDIAVGDYYLRVSATDVADDITVLVHEENPHYRVLVTVAEA